MGRTTRTLPVREGLNALWVRADGELSSVTLGRARDDVLVCVDEVEVGLVEPELRPGGGADGRGPAA